jgi:ankyrin repeat protein
VTDFTLESLKKHFDLLRLQIIRKEGHMKNFSDLKTLLLECKEGKGKTVLHFAAARGDIDIFDYLLSEGADLNALDDEKNTPFFIAIQHEKIKLIKHMIEKLKVNPKIKR